MDPTERQQWQLTGTVPERLTKPESATTDAPADSSPAEPAAQASDASAAPSAAATPAKPVKKNADTRVQELLAERARDREEAARLRGQLEALQRPAPDAKPAAPSAAPTQAEYERYLAMPGAPNEADFDNYGKFTAAMSVFIADQRWQEHTAHAQQRAQREHHERAFQKTVTDATQRINDRLTADPTFRERIDPALLDIPPASLLPEGMRVGPHHVLADELLKSPVNAELLEHFSTDDGRKDWRRLCAMPPTELLRAFGRLEARFEGSASAPASAPVPKHVSSAPEPQIVLGARGNDSADPIAKALKDKDFERYTRLANQRDLASIAG